MDERHVSRLGCGLLLLICFVVSGAIVYQLRSRTAGPEEEANSFLRLLSEGKADKAYADAARSLRRHKTAGMLTIDAQIWGLSSYAHSSWERIQVEDRKATLKGSVTTKSGEVIPLVLNLVREEDRWCVESIAPNTPAVDEAGAKDAPSHSSE